MLKLFYLEATKEIFSLQKSQERTKNIGNNNLIRKTLPIIIMLHDKNISPPTLRTLTLSSYETSRIAIIIKMEPMLETTVRASPRTIVDIATATIISVKRTTAEVTGEICFNPFSQK